MVSSNKVHSVNSPFANQLNPNDPINRGNWVSNMLDCNSHPGRIHLLVGITATGTTVGVASMAERRNVKEQHQVHHKTQEEFHSCYCTVAIAVDSEWYCTYRMWWTPYH